MKTVLRHYSKIVDDHSIDVGLYWFEDSRKYSVALYNVKKGDDMIVGQEKFFNEHEWVAALSTFYKAIQSVELSISFNDIKL